MWSCGRCSVEGEAMGVSRRDLLRAACAASVLPEATAPADDHPPGALGMVIHSFAVRGRDKAFSDPLRFLAYCRVLGVNAIQVGIGVRDDAYTDELRSRAEMAWIALEGIAS